MERNPSGNNIATSMLCQTCSQYIFKLQNINFWFSGFSERHSNRSSTREKTIDRQVSLIYLVRLQTDNFRLFLCQQMDKRQTSTKSKRKSPGLPFSIFRLKQPHVYIYAQFRFLYMYIQVNRSNGKQRLLFVCCKQKTETANFHFVFGANGNRKRKLFSLVGK